MPAQLFHPQLMDTGANGENILVALRHVVPVQNHELEHAPILLLQEVVANVWVLHQKQLTVTLTLVQVHDFSLIYMNDPLIIKFLCYFSILIFFFILADVDECTANTHNCHSDATCTNTNGGFTCACKSGFQGPGTSCTGK